MLERPHERSRELAMDTAIKLTVKGRTVKRR